MTRRDNIPPNPPPEPNDWQSWREGIIGLRESSSRKSYYPELQARLAELEKTREHLAEVNRRLQAVLDAASEVAIIACDAQGLVAVFNKGAEKMLGYSAEEVIGRTTPMIFHAESEVAACVAAVGESEGLVVSGFDAILHCARRQDFEWRAWKYLRKDGSQLDVSLTITIIRGADGEVAGYLGIAIDVTERKRASEALRRAHDELELRVEERTQELTQMNDQLRNEIAERLRAEEERASAQAELDAAEALLRQSQKLEAIGQLASGIAHEINTPTQYIGDNTRFLRDSCVDVKQVLDAYRQMFCAVKEGRVSAEMLNNLDALLEEKDFDYLTEQIPASIAETLEGVERVSKIVRAMKEFSHPDGQEKAPADLNRAIESTVTVARNEWRNVADVELDLDAQLPMVSCFLYEINQALLNLIVNAAHAIGSVVQSRPGAKGVIAVSSRLDGEFVEIRVKDTGCGIPDDIKHRIFEPFFTTKGVGRGSGQGLSVAHGCIVKRHGGALSFESKFGEGSTFIIRLPIAPQQP